MIMEAKGNVCVLGCRGGGEITRNYSQYFAHTRTKLQGSEVSPRYFESERRTSTSVETSRTIAK